MPKTKTKLSVNILFCNSNVKKHAHVFINYKLLDKLSSRVHYIKVLIIIPENYEDSGRPGIGCDLQRTQNSL